MIAGGQLSQNNSYISRTPNSHDLGRAELGNVARGHLEATCNISNRKFFGLKHKNSLGDGDLESCEALTEQHNTDLRDQAFSASTEWP